MICVNELSALKCRNRHILEPIVVLLAPFTPHLSEELWHALGHNTTVCDAQWPAYNEEYLKEDTVNYAVSFNGKVRFNLEFPAEAPPGRDRKNSTRPRKFGKMARRENS